MKARVPASADAQRRAQALAETNRHAVEMLGPFARRYAGRDDGVP